MLKKFLFSFLALVGYMAFFAVLLLPLVIYEKTLDQEIFNGLLFTWLALLLTSFFPALLIIANRVWFFPGNNVYPTELSELKKQLLEINHFDLPIEAKETKRGKIIFTWKYVDAKWWEFLAKAGLQKSYALHVRFNEKKKEAILIDVSKSLAWKVGVSGANFGWWGFRGIQTGFSIGQQYGIKENFSLGQVYNFTFDPSEIKTPVMNTILKNGWNVRFGIF
jgi:hypothetical protein